MRMVRSPWLAASAVQGKSPGTECGRAAFIRRFIEGLNARNNLFLEERSTKYMYVYMSVYLRAHIYMYVYMYIHIYSIHMYMHICCLVLLCVYTYTLRSPGGVHILAEDRRHILKTHGVQGWASTHGLRRHVGVSRHMPGEDSEDTWASEDTFPAKTRVGRRVVAKTHVFAKTLPERTVLAKACPEVKP